MTDMLPLCATCVLAGFLGGWLLGQVKGFNEGVRGGKFQIHQNILPDGTKKGIDIPQDKINIAIGALRSVF